MAVLIDQKRMVDNATFMYENRLKSSVAQYLDTGAPTYVTYYHINNLQSTTDTGYKDVFSHIGSRSPMRYSRITDFPLYGLERIQLALQEEDQGLDTEYEGEAVIMPGSIKPLPNDYFIIPVLKDPYMFRVTGIDYDSIMPDNYYKINFRLELLDDTKVEQIDKQVTGKFTCITQNIGTEETCILEETAKETLDAIDLMYDDMASTYKAIFYNERHNVFLGEIGPNLYLYDPLQTQFINEHQLFNKRENMQVLMLTDEYEDPKRRIKYERSIYRFIERRNPKLVKPFYYDTFPGINHKPSSFYRWLESNILILDIPSEIADANKKAILSDDFVLAVKVNGFTNSKHADLIKRYARNETLTIHDIPLDLNDELLELDGNMEVFFFTPILMYIIKDVVNSYMTHPVDVEQPTTEE